MSDLVVLDTNGNWHSSLFNMGDRVEFEGYYRGYVKGFSVLPTESPINYDIGLGRDIPEDELTLITKKENK